MTVPSMANDSDYGLGAAFWTGNLVRGRAFASRIDAAAVFVNIKTVWIGPAI